MGSWTPETVATHLWLRHGMLCATAPGPFECIDGGPALCGYIKVPAGHPRHGLEFWSHDDGMPYGNEIDWSRPSVRDGGWWVGFSCTHYNQVDGRWVQRDGECKYVTMGIVYPELVIGEVERLADALHEVGGPREDG